jgi:hypothetical protein
MQYNALRRAERAGRRDDVIHPAGRLGAQTDFPIDASLIGPISNGRL